jgi:hypothetical protein
MQQTRYSHRYEKSKKRIVRTYLCFVAVRVSSMEFNRRHRASAENSYEFVRVPVRHPSRDKGQATRTSSS